MFFGSSNFGGVPKNGWKNTHSNQSGSQNQFWGGLFKGNQSRSVTESVSVTTSSPVEVFSTRTSTSGTISPEETWLRLDTANSQQPQSSQSVQVPSFTPASHFPTASPVFGGGTATAPEGPSGANGLNANVLVMLLVALSQQRTQVQKSVATPQLVSMSDIPMAPIASTQSASLIPAVASAIPVISTAVVSPPVTSSLWEVPVGFREL